MDLFDINKIINRLKNQIKDGVLEQKRKAKGNNVKSYKLEPKKISVTKLKKIAELNKKKYSKFDFKVMQNFIYEFEITCGKFLSQAELAQRLMENFNGCIFGLESDNYVAAYLCGEGKKNHNVEIARDKFIEYDSTTRKSILFHELMHAVTYNLKYNCVGFEKLLNKDEKKKTAFVGKGINEAVVEYVTNKRNKLFPLPPDAGVKVGFYDYAPELIEVLDKFLSEGTLINTIINAPQNLNDVLGNKSTAIVKGLDYLFFNNMDCKYDCKSSQNYLDTQKSREVYSYVLKNIIEIKCKDESDYKKKVLVTLDTLKKLSKGKLKICSNYPIYDYLYTNIVRAIKSGVQFKDIESNIDEEQKNMIHKSIIVHKLKHCKSDELVRLLNDKKYLRSIKKVFKDENFEVIDMNASFYNMNFKHTFMDDICQIAGLNENINIEFLQSNIAKKLVKRGIDLRKIEFEECYSKSLPNGTFGTNIFALKEGKKEYIGTAVSKCNKKADYKLVQYDDYDEKRETKVQWITIGSE